MENYIMTDTNTFYLLSTFDNNDCKSIFNLFSEDEFTVIYTKEIESVYMLCHLYDPLFCKNYINNGLYYSFIELCKQKHIESICFGSSDIHDSGLIHFKDYYSTEKKIYFSLIVPSANLF